MNNFSVFISSKSKLTFLKLEIMCVVLFIFFVKIISNIKMIKLGVNMEYWTGSKITSLKENEIFLYGSNPLL